MVITVSRDYRVVNHQREKDGGGSRFVQYQLIHKSIERIVVRRRHAGIDVSDGDCLRFVDTAWIYGRSSVDQRMELVDIIRC
jgi:hypothetical protein